MWTTLRTAGTYYHNRGYVSDGNSYLLQACRLRCSTTKQQDLHPRRPSTNRMYDNRWLGPTAAQIAAFLYCLFDTHGLSPQTIKGYRSCLASVPSCKGNASAVQAKTILSDMITSMELQRPRMTPVLPQWDLGIVLEALSKPCYEPLREASFKHLIEHSLPQPWLLAENAVNFKV